MKRTPPIGEPDGTPYVDRNLPATRGSRVPAAAIDGAQTELHNLLVAWGVTPDGNDLTQVYQAIDARIAAAFAAYLDTVNGYTKQQYALNVGLVDAPTIAWDLDVAQFAFVDLEGNRTLATPTNMRNRGVYSLHVIQDATGGRTLSYSGVYRWPGGVAPTIDPTPSSRTILRFESNGSLMFGSSWGSFAG